MKRACIVAAVFGALALSGCKKPDAAAPSSEAAEDPWWTGHPSRYQGVGLYPPDHLWTKMAATTAPKDAAAALLGDDSQVIVVVDSRTGEIRQCGNRSGVCVAMNPWDRKLVQPLRTPVALTEHERPEPVPEAATEKSAVRKIHRAAPAGSPSEAASKADAMMAPAADPGKP